MSDLLIQAMTAKQNGDISLAKQLLSQAIIQDPRNEGAWMMMADIVDDVNLRKNCLERVLGINPANPAAILALNKLNTAALGPVFSGERNKPPDTPQAETKPPFTPPFTWDDKPEPYLALGDLTFPNIPEETNPLPETPPTFDWVNESEEPDRTIDKIFDAVSKPELASEPPSPPPTQKASSWLDDLRPSEDFVEAAPKEKRIEPQKPPEPQDVEDPWLRELVGSEADSVQEQRPLTRDDFSVSAEPELGLQAFTTSDGVATATEPDSLLWDNPRAKADRLVILSYRSLIYANPAEEDVPHIVELFNQDRMVRDLLGDAAYMIKLENIDRILVNPKKASMSIDYKLNGKPVTHQLTFSSPQVRNDVLTAMKFRLGAAFKEVVHTTTLEDKILSPIVILVLVAAIAWALVWGVPAVSALPGFDIGSPQVFLSSVQQAINQFGTFYILLIAGVIAAGCILWMVLNLRKPSSEVILKR